MAFAENLGTFFTSFDFGVEASYSRVSGGDPVVIEGIFDAQYVEPTTGVAEDSGPVFTCATSSVPNAAHGDELVINGTTYVVRGVHPDGTGVTVLVLERQ